MVGDLDHLDDLDDLDGLHDLDDVDDLSHQYCDLIYPMCETFPITPYGHIIRGRRPRSLRRHTRACLPYSFRPR